MQTVALISDYGDNSIDLMSLKLAINHINITTKILDIHNNINKFDCNQAMFVLENFVQLNKQSCIIIVAVNHQDINSEEEVVICTINKTTIITYNNGYISFLNNLGDNDFYGYKNGRGETLLIEAYGILLNNDIAAFDKIKPKEVLQSKPSYFTDIIKMTIVSNDRFGNAYTNIRQKEFEQWVQGYNFEIILSRRDRINAISSSFNAVSTTSLLAYFTQAGVLAIGINMGNSTQLFRLKPGEVFNIKRSNSGLF